MIGNWLKNALIALVFNACAAYAFNGGSADTPGEDSRAQAMGMSGPVQSCTIPTQLSAEPLPAPAALANDQEAHS